MLLLAALGTFSAVVAVYALTLMPAPQRKGNGLAENVLWGKLFIAATYASIAIVAFLAMNVVR